MRRLSLDPGSVFSRLGPGCVSPVPARPPVCPGAPRSAASVQLCGRHAWQPPRGGRLILTAVTAAQARVHLTRLATGSSAPSGLLGTGPTVTVWQVQRAWGRWTCPRTGRRPTRVQPADVSQLGLPGPPRRRSGTGSRRRPPAWVTGSQGEVPARHLAAAHHPAAGPARPRPWPRLTGFRSRLGWCEGSGGSGTSAREIPLWGGAGGQPEAPPAGSPCGARPQDPGPVTRTEGRRSSPRRPALVPPMDNRKPANQGPRHPVRPPRASQSPPLPSPVHLPPACAGESDLAGAVRWAPRLPPGTCARAVGACRPPRTP